MIKNKKAVAIMVGYVLLITFAIIISVFVYQWLKTYVPSDSLKCPEGISISINEALVDNSQLNLTIKNSGRFNIAGYFIHVANNSNQEVATIDLSSEIHFGGTKYGNAVLFGFEQENIIKPNDRKTTIFNLSDTIYLIEIIPMRFQEEKNKIRIVSCSEGKIKLNL